MNNKKYRLVRDGTIKTYDEWIQDHCDKYAGDDQNLAKMNIDWMIEQKWLIEG